MSTQSETVTVTLERKWVGYTLEWIESCIKAASRNTDPSWFAFRDTLQSALQVEAQPSEGGEPDDAAPQSACELPFLYGDEDGSLSFADALEDLITDLRGLLFAANFGQKIVIDRTHIDRDGFYFVARVHPYVTEAQFKAAAAHPGPQPSVEQGVVEGLNWKRLDEILRDPACDSMEFVERKEVESLTAPLRVELAYERRKRGGADKALKEQRDLNLPLLRQRQTAEREREEAEDECACEKERADSAEHELKLAEEGRLAERAGRKEERSRADSAERRLATAGEGLEAAEDFLERVTDWEGSDEDELHDALHGVRQFLATLQDSQTSAREKKDDGEEGQITDDPPGHAGEQVGAAGSRSGRPTDSQEDGEGEKQEQNWLLGPGGHAVDGPVVTENIAVVPQAQLDAAEHCLREIARAKGQAWRDNPAVLLARGYFDGREIVESRTVPSAPTPEQPEDQGTTKEQRDAAIKRASAQVAADATGFLSRAQQPEEPRCERCGGSGEVIDTPADPSWPGGLGDALKSPCPGCLDCSTQESGGEEESVVDQAWREAGRSALVEMFEAITPYDGSMPDSHSAAMLAPHAWAEVKQLRAERDSRLTKEQCRFLLKQQAEEYRVEGRAQTGDEARRLFTAANVVDAVTIIVFGESAALAAAFPDKETDG